MMSEAVLRVLICDDHEVVRRGIRSVLIEDGGFEVVAEAANGQQAIAHALRLRPDVILMDLVMPLMDGVEATHRILQEWPEARVLVLTTFVADDRVIPAIKAGVLGYLLKDSTPDQLLQAVRQIGRGEPSLPPTIARKLMNEISHPAEPSVDGLSERELEVLRLVVEGLSNREIANRLVISEPTVRAHMTSILSKLHLNTRTQAALHAVKAGLVRL